MFKKSAPVLLLGGVLLAVSCAATAQGKGAGNQGGTSVVPTVAGSGGKISAETLVQRYAALAGSPENAQSLVNGLRTGNSITLVGEAPPPPPPAAPPPPPGPSGFFAPPPPAPPSPASTPSMPETVTFTPPTGNMGWGNVDIALALTQALLTQQNVSKPTPRQLHAALMDANNGILQLRAGGMGWPNIAKTLGFTLK